MADNSISLSPPSLDESSDKDINITGPMPATSTPLTDREVAGQLMGRRAYLLTGIKGFEERNRQDGVPLDTETGVAASQRLALDFRREPDQRAYLEHVYGTGNVRKSDRGDWIVRSQNPQSGTTTDYTVDPQSLNKGDLLGLVPMAKELAAYYVGGKLLSAVPKIGEAGGLIGKLRDVIGGTAAVQGSGAAQDAAIRGMEDRPIDFGEIMRSRTVQGAMDLGLGGATASADSLVRFLRNPFLGSRSQVQVDGMAARDALARKYGVYIEMTPGEVTGSPTLSRKESFLEKVPGSSEVYRNFIQNRTQDMTDLQSLMLGGKVPSNDVLGDQAIRALQANVAPTELALSGARNAVSSSAMTQIQKQVSESTLGESQFTRTYVGDAIRNRVNVLRDDARASANALYDRVRELGGSQPIFETGQLSKDAGDLLDKLPPQWKESVSSSREGVLPFAQFSTSTVSKVPSTAFASETHIISKLKELINSEGHNYTLNDLQQMRREVFDDMAKGEAVPGLSTHYLSKIGGMLTSTIERGVQSLPDGELKTALQSANTFYRENVLPFENKGVAEIFNPLSEKGHIGPAELASRLTSGPSGTDKFNILKGLLGGDSIEINLLKRQMADDVIGGAMKPGEQTLDAASLLSRMDNFKRTNPDMYSEIFGANGDSIMREGKMLKLAQGDQLPADEVRQMIQQPGSTASKLSTLLSAQRDLNATYRNRILQGIRTGNFDATSINPSDFVNRFTSNASVPEIKDVMARLSDRPALLEDIRSSYLQDLFQSARTSKNRSIGQALEDASTSDKAKAILGDDLFNDVGNLSKVQETMIAKRTQGESAGAFSAGRRVDEILTKPLSYTSDYVREMVTAKVLSSKTLMNMMSKVPPSEPSRMYMMLSSPPFIRGVLDSFSDGMGGLKDAKAFISSVKTGLDQYSSSAFEPRTPMSLRTSAMTAEQKGRGAPSANAAFYLSPPTIQ